MPSCSLPEPENESQNDRLNRLYEAYKQFPSQEALGEMFTICQEMSRWLVWSAKRRFRQVDGIYEHEFDEAVQKVLNELSRKKNIHEGKFPNLFLYALKRRLNNVGRDVIRKAGRETAFSNIGPEGEEYHFNPDEAESLAVHDQPPDTDNIRLLQDRMIKVLMPLDADSLDMYLRTLQGEESADIARSYDGRISAAGIRKRVSRINGELRSLTGLGSDIDDLSVEEQRALVHALMAALPQLIAIKAKEESPGTGRE
jgi:hypothetical protein